MDCKGLRLITVTILSDKINTNDLGGLIWLSGQENNAIVVLKM